ncbi:Winged helix DNA-binding domain-containing protein [Mucilaginibacter mallensis]|uniref:Winged helix DNA-binding domain-containing protein n=1 Tax=Mucilaginibacter mallensis TaxID=652787 RepID=A0A1H1T7V7_MUCMA|nr:winged helix DNA-binding domain-containing protein [Mucilaginibacter mallensis]SDS56228.1 Winged helix DNA-binding domain-containing protein [Mucilaginibacter mallensis]
MTEGDILQCRLSSHLITNSKPDSAEKVANWMGAIQAQDYGQAKYAIGCRTNNLKNIDIEKAITDKKIVRTWALRGTLHILAASDIYWILSTVTPVLLSRYQPQFKKLGLADEDFTRIHKCIVQLLQGGKQLTRKELFAGLEQNNITTAGLRGALMLYKAGWLGMICLGPQQGKQDTYTLLEEWLPKPSPITRQEALVKLMQKYFQSHGPATLQDFIAWSGLSITESRAEFEQIRETLTKIEWNDQSYWMTGNYPANNKSSSSIDFLAGFDEYLLGYKDRSLILDAANTGKVILQNGIFKPIIIKNGKVIGTWNRVINKNKLNITIELFDKTDQQTDLSVKIEKYSSFMNLS